MKKQKGFAVVEGLLILVIVVLVAGIGWYVWNSKNQTDKILSSTNNNSVTKSPKKVTATITKTPANTPNKTTNSTLSLYPPDSSTPAAGACALTSDSEVLITANPDLPDPRCVKVAAQQTLTVKNASEQTTEVTFANYKFTLAPGSSHTITTSFGSYLQTGVHILRFGSLYAGSGAEIWLQ